MDRAAIQEVIPHRDPFLFVDEVEELKAGERIKAKWRVSEDCFFFAGHFPGLPILPGVIMLESLAQAGAIAILSQDEMRGKVPLFAGIDEVKFKRIVRPGEVLDLEVEIIQRRGNFGKGRAVASVGGQVACQAVLFFAIAEKGSLAV